VHVDDHVLTSYQYISIIMLGLKMNFKTSVNQSIQSFSLFSQLCSNKNKCEQNNVKHSDGRTEQQITHLELVAQISTKFYTKYLETDRCKDRETDRHAQTNL